MTPGKGTLHFLMKRFLPYIIFICIAAISCGPAHFAPVQLNVYNYNMEGSRQGTQTGMMTMLKPYADSVNASMNLVLGSLEVQLVKSWPSCSLGYFMTDAYKEGAEKKFNRKVDVAAMNMGGIRLNAMEPGPVTRGKIFELMPFDNLMVLIELDGATLQAFLDHIASRGGWPLTGAELTIEQKKATRVLIGGKPIDPAAKYVLATSDYVANGGDDSNVLKGLPQINIGYLQRDAILDYVSTHNKIELPDGNRVVKKDE